MPLTLACICPGAVAGTVCEVAKIEFVLTTQYTPGVNVACVASAKLICSPIGLNIGHTYSAVGTDTYDLTPYIAGLIAHWSDLHVDFAVTASTFQQPLEYPGAIWAGSWKLEITYRCTDLATGLYEDYVYQSVNGSGENACKPDGVTVVSSTMVGGGVGLSNMFASHPIYACNGSAVSVGNFTPPPIPGSLKLTTTGACLCPSGGTGPYYFSVVSGSLPSGVTLNPSTGCFAGSPDGASPGSASVTFQVRDSLGATARVDCGMLPTCGGGAAQEIGNSFY